MNYFTIIHDHSFHNDRNSKIYQDSQDTLLTCRASNTNLSAQAFEIKICTKIKCWKRDENRRQNIKVYQSVNIEVNYAPRKIYIQVK